MGQRVMENKKKELIYAEKHLAQQVFLKQLDKIEDSYDLRALVGKYMDDFAIPLNVKDKIKDICEECFILGAKIGEKNESKNC